MPFNLSPLVCLFFKKKYSSNLQNQEISINTILLGNLQALLSQLAYLCIPFIATTKTQHPKTKENTARAMPSVVFLWSPLSRTVPQCLSLRH